MYHVVLVYTFAVFSVTKYHIIIIPISAKKSMLRLEILVAKPSQYKPTSERKVNAELKG